MNTKQRSTPRHQGQALTVGRSWLLDQLDQLASIARLMQAAECCAPLEGEAAAAVLIVARDQLDDVRAALQRLQPSGEEDAR